MLRFGQNRCEARKDQSDLETGGSHGGTNPTPLTDPNGCVVNVKLGMKTTSNLRLQRRPRQS